jgi:AMMECR1 domain-containing protein
MKSLVLPLFLLSAGAVAVAQETPATRPAEPLAPPPPLLKPIDQAYLIRTAREAITAASTHSRPSEPVYVPPGLREMRCPVFITLRNEGALLAIGQSEASPVVLGVAAAAENALRTAFAKKKPITPERGRTCSIEIELLGPAVPVGTAAERSEQLADRYEPGIEGIGARIGTKDVFIRPSQIVSLEPQCLREGETSYRCNRYLETIDSVLSALGIATGSDDGGKEAASIRAGTVPPESVGFSRYRTLHFWQKRPGERPVELISGMRLVMPDEVTPARLDEVIRQTARYIRYRQRPDGFFAYEFLPGRDHYNIADQNWVRQAGVIWSAAVYARITGDAGWRRCSDRAIEAMRRMTRPRAGVEEAVFLPTPDGENKLGATALLGLALLDAPEPERYTGLAIALGDAVRSMQNANGRFVVNFPPATDQPGNQDYSPGEALLFLARLYDRSHEPRWRETLDRALPYYRKYYVEAATPPFVVWQMQAWGQLARTTTLKRYADFVFDMADRLITSQLRIDVTPAEPMSIYDGGLDVYAKRRTGISTAPYVEGLIEALRTARAFRETARAGRYADVIGRATRFILQLQFKPEEAYYVRSPTDVIDGFRSSPLESAIRIDNDQHALFALMGARALLWPDAPTTKPAR